MRPRSIERGNEEARERFHEAFDSFNEAALDRARKFGLFITTDVTPFALQ